MIHHINCDFLSLCERILIEGGVCVLDVCQVDKIVVGEGELRADQADVVADYATIAGPQRKLIFFLSQHLIDLREEIFLMAVGLAVVEVLMVAKIGIDVRESVAVGRGVGERRFICFNELLDGIAMKASASSAHCWPIIRFNCNTSSSIVYIKYSFSSYF